MQWTLRQRYHVSNDSETMGTLLMQGWGWEFGWYNDHIRSAGNPFGSGQHEHTGNENNLVYKATIGNGISNRTRRSLTGKVSTKHRTWNLNSLPLGQCSTVSSVADTSKKKKNVWKNFPTLTGSAHQILVSPPIHPTVSSALVSLG